MCPCKIALLVGVAAFLIVVLGILWKKHQLFTRFNWEKELNKNNPDWNKMEDLAGSWATCAVGTYYHGPTWAGREPQDAKVCSLGMMFLRDIEDGNKAGALNLIKQIKDAEERRTKLC